MFLSLTFQVLDSQVQPVPSALDGTDLLGSDGTDNGNSHILGLYRLVSKNAHFFLSFLISMHILQASGFPKSDNSLCAMGPDAVVRVFSPVII